MDSTPNPKKADDPHDVLIAHADEALAHAYEQIARADEQIERVHEQLSKIEHDAKGHPSEPQTHVETFHSAVPSDRPALRGLVALLSAACICVAAIAWQSSYGNAARLIIARWAPHPVLTSSLALEKPGVPAQPSSSSVQVAAAEPEPRQPAPSVQTAPQDVAPTAAPASPELMQLLQTMARDLANVAQGIEQLKASQEQMASDDAKAVEQLKASQEQMARVIARASEQNQRPKASAPPSRPIAPRTRKPLSLQSPQAIAQPLARMQLQSEEQEPQLSLAPRPPIPLP
jgi:hypothetical protein